MKDWPCVRPRINGGWWDFLMIGLELRFYMINKKPNSECLSAQPLNHLCVVCKQFG